MLNPTSHRGQIETTRPRVTPAGDEAPDPPSGSRPNMLRRPPKTFLLLAFALTALLIGGVVAILNDRPGADSGSPPLPIAEPTPATADETGSMDQRIAALERRLEEVGTELALQSNETAKRIDANAETLRTLQEQVNALPAEERLAALEGSFAKTRDGFAKRMSGLELSLKKLRAPAKPTAPEAARLALPFDLVSVDVWDGVPYVALSHDGRIELVRAGQSRTGWTVQLIDSSRGLVLFRNRQGRALERAVPR
jgi:hypothetical protein